MDIFESNYTHLTTDELLDLIKDNNTTARKYLVTQHINLVHFTIKKYNYTRYKRKYEDIYQDGCIGLITGIQEYSESDRSVTLATYVVLHIRNTINRNAQSYYDITGPIAAISQRNDLQITKMKMKRKLKHKITPEQLENETGISAKRQFDLQKLDYQTVAFADPSYDKIGNSLHEQSHISKFNNNLIHHQRRIQEKIESKIVINTVLKSERLDDRERFILNSIYGLNGHNVLPFKEIAHRLNISTNRIHQLHKYILRKMRHPATSKKLIDNVSTPTKIKSNKEPLFKFSFNDNRRNTTPKLKDINIMFVGYNSYGYKPYNKATDHPAYKQLTKDLEEYIELKLKSKPYKITGLMSDTSNLNITWSTALQNIKKQQPERIIIQEEEQPVIKPNDIDLLILVLDTRLKTTQTIINQAKNQNVKTIIVTPDTYFK